MKTVFREKETDTAIYWYVRQENRHSVMETRARCLKKDMLPVNYEQSAAYQSFITTVSS